MAKPDRAKAEARRYRRSGMDRQGQNRSQGRGRQDPEGRSGHPMLFSMRPAIELDPFPSGGGYPERFVEAAAKLMRVDLTEIVHLCSGSVRGGRLTIDVRPEAGPDLVADVRWLPLGANTVSAFLADPPYDPDYAQDLWGTGDVYPSPMVLLRECEHALVPGGRVGLLHHLVPVLPDGLRQIGVYGVATGPGYRIRAFTVAEKVAQHPAMEHD